jgi:hypothetical protein
MFPGAAEPVFGVPVIAFAAVEKGVQQIVIGIAFAGLGGFVGRFPMIMP